MYDLKLIPIHQEKGQPIPQQTGFLAASPPRRAVRSRAEDMLIVSFKTSHGESPSAAVVEAWLAKLVETFFKTSGSVTAALRMMIETLNLTMMENNLKSAKTGAPVLGAINLAAIHHRTVYVAQSGLTHAYALTQTGLEHFYDASQMDRGLGLSRTPTIRYYQAELGAGGYLFMTDTPAGTWTADQLMKDGLPTLEQLRRRLLNQASPNLRLDLVQILPGEGQIKTALTPAAEPEPADQAEPMAAPEAPALPAEDILVEEPGEDDAEVSAVHVEEQPQVDEEAERATLEGTAADEPLPAPVPEPESVQEDTHSLPVQEKAVEEAAPLPADRVEEIEASGADERPEKPKRARRSKSRQARKAHRSFDEQVDVVREEGLKGLARFFAWWGKARADMGRFYRERIARGSSADEQGLSLRTALTIAIAVPILVVGIAVGIYLSRGRSLQYRYYLEQADVALASAQAAEGLDAARTAYAQAVLFLDQAESYRRTDEVTQLRSDTQRALDVLDGAVRLNFHPAIIGTLYSEINITRIISHGLDLYLLDAAGGRVIHAVRASQGYQVNADFLCRSGNFSGGAVDMLVDMAPLPINNPYQAHIMAADAFGNVVYCGPGREPVVQTLPRGERGLGAVARITSEGSLLYVLDPGTEAVWVYRSTNGQFLDPPTDFFAGAEAGVRPALSPIVDLAINGPELYLLQGDGRLVHCVASGLPGNPVNCENPVAFVDGRLGKEDQPVAMPDSRFVSVLFTAPPNPAVNILDADQADIFLFSLRFRLNKRMRSDFGNYEILSPTATAFTIGVDRIVFIAFGHQVFWAYME